MNSYIKFYFSSDLDIRSIVLDKLLLLFTKALVYFVNEMLDYNNIIV